MKRVHTCFTKTTQQAGSILYTWGWLLLSINTDTIISKLLLLCYYQ